MVRFPRAMNGAEQNRQALITSGLAFSGQPLALFFEAMLFSRRLKRLHVSEQHFADDPRVAVNV